MLKIPDKIVFANLPTKIEKLDRLSKKLNGPNIYIKRDDETGFEAKVEKILEEKQVLKFQGTRLES